ncbi:MAG TPA: hypothetical protein DCS05_09290 [Nitrospiraceae bacterium]|nr:hypothetical protein [Nitrospiraceae bacterium]
MGFQISDFRFQIWGPALCLLLLPVVAGTYTIVDLGLPPGTRYAIATDINNAGEIVGCASASGYTADLKPFIVTSTHVLAFLPLPKGATGGEAWCINDQGTASGFYTRAGIRQGCLWVGPGHDAIDVGPLGSIVYSVNNAAQTAAGYYASGGKGYTAFTWSSQNGVKELDYAWSVARAINDAGTVLLQVYFAPPYTSSTVDRFGTLRLVEMPTAPTGTRGYAINASGEVAGWTADWQAFTWSPANGGRRLGVLPGDVWSIGYAINNRGDVAGISVGGPTKAMFWSEAAGMQGLPDLSGGIGWYYSCAWGVNDLGQICGASRADDGSLHAVEWVPSPLR